MSDPDERRVAANAVLCPWCGSSDTHEIREYGSLLMTAQWFCERCHSPFERVRHRGDDPG